MDDQRTRCAYIYQQQYSTEASITVILRTIAGAHTLAASGECEGLPHRHLGDVEVMLADVGGRPLGHKLLHAVAVVGHPA